MIQGVSEFMYRYNPDQASGFSTGSIYMADVIPYFNTNIGELVPLKDKVPARILARGDFPEFYFSYDAIPEGEEKNFTSHHVSIQYIDANKLNVDELVKDSAKYSKACFVTKYGFLLKGEWYNHNKERGQKKPFITTSAVEKMSKSKLNVENPDDIVYKYGADTFRMYEMFLGPVEMSKPWDTKGIEGVHRFLKKFWRLFFDEIKGLIVTDEEPTAAELKVLHNADILQQLADTHQRLLDYIRDVPEAHFTRETPFRRRLRLDTYSHYPIHTKMIEEWRERLS
jgi:hypothetical protein